MNDTEKQKIRSEFGKFCNTDNFSAPPYETDTIADYWLSILDKTIKSKLEAVEGEIKYASECDKLDEVDERARITNLLNENMVVGYNCAVEDFKKIINKHK